MSTWPIKFLRGLESFSLSINLVLQPPSRSGKEEAGKGEEGDMKLREEMLGSRTLPSLSFFPSLPSLGISWTVEQRGDTWGHESQPPWASKVCALHLPFIICTVEIIIGPTHEVVLPTRLLKVRSVRHSAWAAKNSKNILHFNRKKWQASSVLSIYYPVSVPQAPQMDSWIVLTLKPWLLRTSPCSGQFDTPTPPINITMKISLPRNTLCIFEAEICSVSK